MLLKPKARYAHTPISNDRAATAIRGCTAACVFTHSPNQIVHAVRSRQMSEAMATLSQKMLEVEAELREAKRAGRQDASKLAEHRDTIGSLQEEVNWFDDEYAKLTVVNCRSENARRALSLPPRVRLSLYTHARPTLSLYTHTRAYSRLREFHPLELTFAKAAPHHGGQPDHSSWQ